jgi:hypothetical protein
MKKIFQLKVDENSCYRRGLIDLNGRFLLPICIGAVDSMEK